MGNQTSVEDLQKIIKEAKETKTLNLQNQNLTKLPSVKLDYEAITGLDLSYNQFEDIPDAVSKFPNLTYLTLANNKIARFTIPPMRKLEKIDLAFNPLVELPSDLHEKTPNLLALTIYDCAVTSLPIETFTTLKHLTAVVNGNHLHIGPDHIPYDITARLPGTWFIITKLGSLMLTIAQALMTNTWPQRSSTSLCT